MEREATEKEMAPMHQKVAALDDKIAEKQAQITAIRARPIGRRARIRFE